jgi:hypothetical protein
MHKLTALFFCFLLLGCSHDETFPGKLNYQDTEELQAEYTALLNRIHGTTRKTALEKIPAYLEKCLVDSVFEYWYGTPWNYYGTTTQPRNGNIACGYFVTTTLKQLGLNIKRTQLAQAASSVLINEVCDKPSIKVFTNGAYNECKKYIWHHPGRIFIAGLDNHVGYIVKQGEEMYFIHSRPNRVAKEKCDEADLLTGSKFFMVGHVNFAHWARGLKK